MKKIAIIESIQERLPQQTHPGDIEKVISVVYATMVAAEVKLNGANNLPYYSVNAVLDTQEVGGVFFLNLPDVIMHIPDVPGSGVVSITPIGDIRECKPVYTGAVSFARNLPVGMGMGGFIWYNVSPNKVTFVNPVAARKFDVWYIKPFEVYHILDEIVIPAGFGDKLYQGVLELLDKTRVRDTANDNVNE